MRKKPIEAESGEMHARKMQSEDELNNDQGSKCEDEGREHDDQ